MLQLSVSSLPASELQAMAAHPGPPNGPDEHFAVMQEWEHPGPPDGPDEELARLQMERVHEALLYFEEFEIYLDFRVRTGGVGKTFVTSLGSFNARQGHWMTPAVAARRRQPARTHQWGLDVPKGWSWREAFTGEGEPPAFEGWDVEACGRDLPEVIRLVNHVGFFSARQPVQNDYDVLLLAPGRPRGSLDGRQSAFSHGPAQRYDRRRWVSYSSEGSA